MRMSAERYVVSNLPPVDESTAFVCPKCGDKSRNLDVPLMVKVREAHNINYEAFSDVIEYSFHGQELVANPIMLAEWSAAVCLGCRTSSVWRMGKLIYPRPAASIQPHAELSETARELFIEATDVLPLSPRAAAALARASMEAQLKHLLPNSTARDLQQRIGELQEHVRPHLWKLLTTLRVVGNDVLHSNADGAVALDVTGADADVIVPLLGAINMLVEEVVTQPREAEALYEKIPKGKRDAAEQAAAKFKTA